MKPDTLRIGLLVIFIALVACGCVRVDIGDAVREATIGQQLIDLDKARRAGAITETELAELRKGVIENSAQKEARELL